MKVDEELYPGKVVVPSEPEQAAREAQLAALRQQALLLINTCRGLRCQLMIADDAKELSPELKEYLFRELLKCAAIVEVQK